MAATVLEPQKKKTRLMTEGSIWKSILLFSVPLILGNLLQQLYNTADSIIVGNFVGSNALAAVGSSGSPIFLLIGFSQGIAVGAGVVVAQYLGAKDREDAQRAVHTALALAVLLGLILTIGGILVSRALLTAMDTPAEVLEDAVTYMQIYFGGVLFSVVYNMHESNVPYRLFVVPILIPLSSHFLCRLSSLGTSSSFTSFASSLFISPLCTPPDTCPIFSLCVFRSKLSFFLLFFTVLPISVLGLSVSPCACFQPRCPHLPGAIPPFPRRLFLLFLLRSRVFLPLFSALFLSFVFHLEKSFPLNRA